MPDAAVPSLEIEEKEALTDPSAINLGDEPVELSAENRVKLAQELEEILLASDASRRTRNKRYEQFEKIYDLIPDAQSGGQTAFSERLVTELGRAHVNTAQARISEQIIGLSNPWVFVEVINGDNLPAVEQKEALAEAKAKTEFLHAYNRQRKLDSHLDDALQTSVKLGNAILKQTWVESKRKRLYRPEAGKSREWATVEDDLSGIKIESIHPRDFVGWPLDRPRLEDLLVVGHRAKLTVSEFRLLAYRLGVSSEEQDEILEAAKNREIASEDRPKAADIRDTNSPYDELEVWELWCQMPLPGEKIEPKLLPRGYVVFFLRDPRRILQVSRNPINCQRHPYFNFPYWRLSGTWLADGVLNEILYRCIADNALRCLEIDSLKVASLNLNLVNDESTLWTQHKKQIAPGAILSTSGKPEDDFASISLGSEVETIHEAQRLNAIKAMEADGITAPIQGFGDPTLKSGASPSSLQMLAAEAGKKLGKVDRNYREALDEFFRYELELIQQYASRQIYYETLSEESAGLMVKAKMMNRPDGDLSTRWKVSVRAPSAEANREVTEQKALIFYDFATRHVQLLLGLSQQVWGQQDPGRVQRVMEEALLYLHGLFDRLRELQKIGPVGATSPQLEGEAEDEIRTRAIQLEQMVQQLQQQVQQAQQEKAMMQQMMAGGQGGMGENFPPAS